MTTSSSAPPEAFYWHAYTDADGMSRQRRCALTAFEKQSMGGAAAQWNDHLVTGPGHILVSVLPVGWVGDWHENPKPQWIIPLSGRWWVETMDGQRVEMGAGEMSLGEDQNCRADAQGHKGHKSGTIGNEPAVLMIIQLDTAPTIDRPGHFS
jgi:hypothetical protein